MTALTAVGPPVTRIFEGRGKEVNQSRFYRPYTEFHVCSFSQHYRHEFYSLTDASYYLYRFLLLYTCNRMVLDTLYYHWKQVLLLYLNTKLKYLFACQNVLFIFSKVHSQFHKCQCYSSYKIVHNNSFKVASNKIHTYIHTVQCAGAECCASSCSKFFSICSYCSEFPFFHSQYTAFRQ